MEATKIPLGPSVVPLLGSVVHRVLNETEDEDDCDNSLSSAKGTAVTYLFILVLLLGVALWSIFAFHNHTSARTAAAPKEKKKKTSLDEHRKQILQAFEQAGNQIVSVNRALHPVDRKIVTHS